MNYKQKKLTIDEILSCLPEEKVCEKCKKSDGLECGYEGNVECNNCDIYTDLDWQDLGFNKCRRQFLDNLEKL